MLFDGNDFFNRLKANFPKRWAGTAAFTPPTTATSADGGRMYALLFSFAQELAFLMTIWAYVRLQTRLATLTDQYCDLASIDFFAGRLPRYANEADSAFTTRIRQRLVAPTGTLDAVLAAVNGYYTEFPDADYIFIDVFDYDSDPVRSVFYGLTDAQFAIVAYYHRDNSQSWYLHQSFSDENTFLDVTAAFTKSNTAFTPALGQLVTDTKDWTYRPVYIISGGDPTYQG